MPSPDPRQSSPAAERNKAAIADQLERLLQPTGRLLEIASGTGQHAVFCAARLPGWTWQPTDPDAASLLSISAWAASCPAPGLQMPRQLDVVSTPWFVEPENAAGWDAIFCANMLHIAPWACCAALMRGAAKALSPQGLLITYGPYLEQGVATAPGNQNFDADLRARDPRWGLRWLHEVTAEANAAGLRLRERVAMPANNQILVFMPALAGA